MEYGLQFHLPSHGDLDLRSMVELGRRSADAGLTQLWVSDNLGSRNPFVALAALGSSVPVSLGTAIMVQYFRSPVEAADSLASLTELMDGTELSVGIGRGNVLTPNLVQTPKPVSFMRETAQCLRALLDGDRVYAKGLPTLAAYFQWAEGADFALKFQPAVPVNLYCGGDGPKSLDVGGRFMDGLLCGTTFLPIAKMGYMEDRLRVFDAAADAEGRAAPRRRVAEIKVSVADDAGEAREFARRGVATRVLALRWRGFTDDDLATLGIDPADVDTLAAEQERRGGTATSDELVSYVTDPMVDAFYIAGGIEDCRDRVQQVASEVERYGIEQIVFSGVAEDFPEGLRLLCDRMLPSLTA